MAVDNRPFKSKEQDGQGNEVIIRDQQLVEQGTTTTMPAGTYFQTLDVDGRPVKISKDNMLNLIVEGLGIIFSGQSDQKTVTKVPTLNGNNFGSSTVATLASVLGVPMRIRQYTIQLTSVGASYNFSSSTLYRIVYVYIEREYRCFGIQGGNSMDVIKETENGVLVVEKGTSYGDIKITAGTESGVNTDIHVILIG